MEYVIFPMKTINITQRYHSAHCAWDIAGKDTGIEPWYAPCTVKVLKILGPGSGYYNSVLFGSCDSYGNQTAVMCEDGVARVLTFSCTHMNSINKFGLFEGKIFPAGTACYEEGTEGQATGNHVHMEVAIGWQTSKPNQNGQYLLTNYTNPANIFRQLSGFNTVQNGNGYTFKTTTSRIVQGGTVSANYLLNTTSLAVRIRSSVVSGSILTTVPQGQSLNIISFLPGFQSDGYQWARVSYNGMTGYSQLDTKNCYTITGNASLFSNMPMYLINNSSSRTPAIRSTPVTGSIKMTIPANVKVRISDMLPGVQSDGYQWFFVNCNGTLGYVQADLKNWLYISA